MRLTLSLQSPPRMLAELTSCFSGNGKRRECRADSEQRTQCSPSMPWGFASPRRLPEWQCASSSASEPYCVVICYQKNRNLTGYPDGFNPPEKEISPFGAGMDVHTFISNTGTRDWGVSAYRRSSQRTAQTKDPLPRGSGSCRASFHLEQLRGHSTSTAPEPVVIGLRLERARSKRLQRREPRIEHHEISDVLTRPTPTANDNPFAYLRHRNPLTVVPVPIGSDPSIRRDHGLVAVMY